MEALRSYLLAARLFQLGGLWPALVEAGAAADGAPQLRGGGAVVPPRGAANARGAHQRMLPGLPCGALRFMGVALVVPRHDRVWSSEGKESSSVRRIRRALQTL